MTFKTSLYNKDSIVYINRALKEIEKKPNNHGYPKKEVNRLLSIESEINETMKRLEETPGSFFYELKKIGEAFKEFQKSYHKTLVEFQQISKFGWYLSPIMTNELDIDNVLKLSRAKDTLFVDTKLLSLFGKQKIINQILNSLSTQFPTRNRLFDEISKTYKLELYSSCITLCYSQTDGICKEIWDIGFFDKEKKGTWELKLKSVLNKSDYGISNIFIEQLGISKNEITMYSEDKYFNNLEKQKNTFNRHRVIHGHSINFGNKINALRAILLLDFINSFVEEFRNQSK